LTKSSKLESKSIPDIFISKRRTFVLFSSKNGTTSTSNYGKDETEFILSIDRQLLNQILISKAEEEKVKVVFNQKLITMDLRFPKCTFFDLKEKKQKVVSFPFNLNECSRWRVTFYLDATELTPM
jgi:hypothetical protein